MLAIVGRRDLGQQAGHHLDDIRDGHFTNLVLRADICRVSSLPPRQRPGLREWAGIVDCEALDMRQALNLDASGRGCRRTQRLCW